MRRLPADRDSAIRRLTQEMLRSAAIELTSDRSRWARADEMYHDIDSVPVLSRIFDEAVDVAIDLDSLSPLQLGLKIDFDNDLTRALDFALHNMSTRDLSRSIARDLALNRFSALDRVNDFVRNLASPIELGLLEGEIDLTPLEGEIGSLTELNIMELQQVGDVVGVSAAAVWAAIRIQVWWVAVVTTWAISEHVPADLYDLSRLEYIGNDEIEQTVARLRAEIPNIEAMTDLADLPGQLTAALDAIDSLEYDSAGPEIGRLQEAINTTSDSARDTEGGGIGVLVRTEAQSPVLLTATIAVLTFDPHRLQIVFDLPSRLDVVSAVLRDLHTLTEAAGIEDATIEEITHGSLLVTVVTTGAVGFTAVATLLRVRAANFKDIAQGIEALVKAHAADPDETRRLVEQWQLSPASDRARVLLERLTPGSKALDAGARLAPFTQEVHELPPGDNTTDSGANEAG